MKSVHSVHSLPGVFTENKQGESLLTVQELVVRLNGGAHIVDNVSFSIRQGETFALLGESGCGKSMTALSLMRLLPDGIRTVSGYIKLDDEDIPALPEYAMRKVRGGRMAMIFQEPGLSLNPVMTVGNQIAEILKLHQQFHLCPCQMRSRKLLRRHESERFLKQSASLLRRADAVKLQVCWQGLMMW